MAVGKMYDHPGFLRFLHSVADCVDDYANVIRAFKRVVFNKNATVSSAPMLDDDGGAHLSYTLEMTARDGKSQARLPGVITLAVPLSRTAPRSLVTLELDITLNGEQLRFTVFSPDLPNVLQDALVAEVARFRGNLSVKFPKLLILEDF